MSITKFLMILLFWTFNFSLMYANIEIDTPDIDGDKKSILSYMSRVFLFSYSNSIGDLNMPGMSKWLSDKGNSPMMVYQALLVYYGSTVAMVVSMLNLLISFLGESFAETRESQ